jgi:hypothetical protein
MRLGPTIHQAVHISHSAKAHATINIVTRHLEMYDAVSHITQSSQEMPCQLLVAESDVQTGLCCDIRSTAISNISSAYPIRLELESSPSSILQKIMATIPHCMPLGVPLRGSLSLRIQTRISKLGRCRQHSQQADYQPSTNHSTSHAGAGVTHSTSR